MSLAECSEYGHSGPEVVIEDAYCDTCGLHFLWMDNHGEGHYDLPVRISVECLRSTEATCFRCGGRVVMATAVPA